MTVEEYKLQGSFVQINKRNIFYLRYGQQTEAIVILHGFPTSSIDYQAVAKSLSVDYSLIIHDHLGFGLSQKTWTDDYLIKDQADIALGLWSELGLKDVHIIAHDYGTSVATEIIARHNLGEIDLNIKSVTLCNGSMLIDMAKLRPIQKMLKHRFLGYIISKLSNRHTFHRNMKSLWYDTNNYDREAMWLTWQLLKYDGGKKVLPKIARYVNQRFRNYDRWIGGLKKSSLPIHLLWAADDPVAVVEMVHVLYDLIDDSYKTIIPKCGHYPMIEKPAEWASECLKFIRQH